MAIQPHPLPSGTSFNNALFQFLRQRGVEDYYNYVYLDGKGIPTTGAGYALVTDQGIHTTPRWQVTTDN